MLTYLGNIAPIQRSTFGAIKCWFNTYLYKHIQTYILLHLKIYLIWTNFTNRKSHHYTCTRTQHQLHTCVAIALAVRRLSPVIMTTSMPMLFRVWTANAASTFTVSAMANMAHNTPEKEMWSRKHHNQLRNRNLSLSKIHGFVLVNTLRVQMLNPASPFSEICKN